VIGRRIQQIRQEKGISLSKLAERAGVAKSYLSSIERDLQSNPSVAVLERIAAVLETDLRALVQEADGSDAARKAEEELPAEWLELAREAMESGISKEQFREFLAFTKWRNEQK